jgi:hypothetical protein
MSAELPQPASAAGRSGVREVSNRPRDRFWRPLPTPRRAAQCARGVASSHRGQGDAVLPIEAARTHAHAISTGAVAILRTFRRRSSALTRSPSDPSALVTAGLACGNAGHSLSYFRMEYVAFFSAAPASPHRRLVERQKTCRSAQAAPAGRGSIPHICHSFTEALTESGIITK